MYKVATPKNHVKEESENGKDEEGHPAKNKMADPIKNKQFHQEICAKNFPDSCIIWHVPFACY